MNTFTCDAVQAKHCAILSRYRNEDPIGSATPPQRVLMMELPLPWEYNVRDSRTFPAGLNEVLTSCQGIEKPFHFLAITSEAHPSPVGYTRLFYFERKTELTNQMNKSEYLIPQEMLSSLIEALLKTSALAPYQSYKQSSDQTRELFICTHGSHDVCCAKYGYPIYHYINETYAPSGKVRAWRTSHFGGHRFAPTMMDFPEGRFWAKLTTEKVDQVILRTGPLDSLKYHYRGWSMLSTYEQVAERELLLKYGWDWLHYHKSVQTKELDAETVLVTIDYSSPDSSIQGSNQIEVFVQGTIDISGCSIQCGQAKQYGVRSPNVY